MGDEWYDLIRQTDPAAGVGFCRVRKSATHGFVAALGVVCKALATDDANLMVQSVITTPAVDLQGDSVDPDGFDTSYHRTLRHVLLDHGTDYPLPVALSEDVNKSYTVRRAGDRWISDSYFHPNKIGHQLYDLVKSDVMRGWSSTFTPTTPGIPLGPYDKAIRRHPMRFPGTKLLEYSVTPNPINAEALTILAEKGRGGAGNFDEVIMKSLRPYMIPPSTNRVVVPDNPVVSKAMNDGENGTEGMKAATPTAKHSYDGMQGCSDIADHLEQGLAQCEHAKGKKGLKKAIDRLRAIVEDLKANGDMVSSDLDDKPEEQDAMLDDPEAVEKNTDGLIKITKARYEAKRWTTKDVANALAGDGLPEVVARKSRKERDAEDETIRKQKALARIQKKFGSALAAV